MQGDILCDLGKIVEQVKESLKLFDYEDIQLSSGFKKAFFDNVSAGGNSVEYKKTTAIITNAAGQKIYAPNQWFVLAAYPVDLIKEIVKYRNITEGMLETYQSEFSKMGGTLMEKKDIYKGLKAGNDSGLKTKFEKCIIKYLESLNQNRLEIQENTKLLMRFVTDDKWWLGGKGIERTNDFYVSPILGVLNLVNASQSYVATIAYAYSNDEKLYKELDTIIESSGDDINTYDGNEYEHNAEEEGKEEMQQMVTDSIEYIEPEYNTYFETDLDRNRIVFGAPGTGKSYKLKQESEELIGCAENHMERVTFHTDYSYSQFVGSYKPVTDTVGNIRYDFVPGPFMRVYVNAVKNTQQIMKAYEAIEQADTMYMFPTNPNPANEDEKWDLFEEITEVNQVETFHASKEAKVGDLALIYVANTKPGYKNGIYAVGKIVSKSEDIAAVRFDYVSYYWPIVDYETLREFNPNIRSNGRVSDKIMELIKDTIIPANPYLLLIEEINRAKVAAVFGDVFQLLDRDDDGVSEYEIQTSEDVRKYLASQLGGVPEDWIKIKLPDNMFIWASMNSADQGVFPMDTAFKRRWNFEYLGINENEEEIEGMIRLGDDPEPIEWNTLRKAINDKLSKQYKINEDKLMGPFFLSKKVLKTDEEGMIEDTEGFIRTFKSKVIMYLYEDAAKQHKYKLFEGCDNSKYSSVCDAFDKIGIRIFGDNFKADYYNNQEG